MSSIGSRRLSAAALRMRMSSMKTYVACLTVVVGCLGAGSANASGEKRTDYRLTSGKGNEVCNAYVENLRAFPGDAKTAVCDPRPHPGKGDFAGIEWLAMDVASNLRMVYAAEMAEGRLADHPERRPSFERWRDNFEAAVRSGEIRPSLRRATVDFTRGQPIAIVGYAPNPDGCESDLRERHYSYSVGHRLFLYTPNDTLKSVGLISRNGGAVLLYKGRPVIVNALRNGKDIYVWTQLEGSNDFQPQRRCHIQVIEKQNARKN